MTKKRKSAQEERVNKSAYSIKERLTELGHKIPLTHVYEILATSAGFRNWSTMKAKLKQSLPELFVGYDVCEQHHYLASDKRKVSIGGDEVANHVEVVGDMSFRHQACVALSKASIESEGSLLILLKPEQLRLMAAIEAVVEKAGLSSYCKKIDLENSNENGISINLMQRDPVEFAEDLADLTDRYVDYDRMGNSIWKNRQTAITSIAIEAVQEIDGIVTNSSLWMRLSLKRILEISSDQKVSDRLREKVKTYLRTIPGYREEKLEQSQITKDQHGYAELVMSRVFEPLSRYPVYLTKDESGVSIESLLRSNKITIIVLPEQADPRDREGVIGGLMISEFVRAVESMSRKSLQMCLIPDITGFEPALLDQMLARATAAGACMIFGSDEPLDSPGLKMATTMKQKDEGTLMLNSKTRKWISFR